MACLLGRSAGAAANPPDIIVYVCHVAGAVLLANARQLEACRPVNECRVTTN